MADPTTPTTITAPTESDLAQWDKFNGLTATASNNLGNLNGISGFVTQAFGALDNGLRKLGVSFASLDTMTTEQSAGFGALTTSILGAKEAFTQLNGIDTERLVTFGGQVNQLFEIIKKGPGTSLATDAISKIMEVMKKGGATADMMSSALAGLKQGSVAIASAFLTSADNSLRLQNAMMQATIQAGNSKELFQGIPKLLDGVGDGFENLGLATKFYTQELENATAALGGNQDLAMKYMVEINRMPGGYKALIAPLKIAQTETDILTASIQFATGAGRKQEEVFEDMKKAMTEYSISGGDALRFSARISEVADNVGAQFKDVQSALHSVADEFKMFVNKGADATKMTQGMADSMRSYVSELTSVGVPVQNAIEMFKNYSSQMKGMTIGQQAFLSTMSGGPGGLRGALQVQDDLAKGNFEKIRRQVEQTIRKTSGPLITREEGMRSEAAAAQYTRQVQVLQQGPLGGMAKTPAEADSLIRAMKEGKPIEPKKTAEQTLSDTMLKGQEWQKGSYTELTKVNTNLQNIMLRGGMANLATAQQMLTGAAGRSLPGGSGYGLGTSPDAQERVLSAQRTIATPAPNTEVFKQVSDAVQNLPKTFKDAWDSFKEVIKGGNKESIQQANDKLLAAIKDQQANMSNLTDTQKAALNTLQSNLQITKEPTTPTTSTTKTPTTSTAPRAATAVPAPRFTFTPVENYARPGQRIPAPMAPTTGGAAGTQTAATRTATGTGVGSAAPGQAVPVTLAPGSAITVNFTGVCPHCGTDVRHSTTDATVSPQSGAKR